MTGRPTKLDAKLLATLEEIADDQWSIRDACGAIGIGETTWRRWCADTSDDPNLVAFRALAARVREGSGAKIEELAWGALRGVLAKDGEWITGPDGEKEYVPGAKDSDKVAAASAVLRLRTVHKVEHSGPGGGAIEFDLPEGAGDAAAAFIQKLAGAGPHDGNAA